MCGIAVQLGGIPSTGVIEQYKKQEHRGNEGFGFIAIKDNRVVQFYRSAYESNLLDKLEQVTHVDAVLLHHRFPTSTINTKEGAHPIPVKHREWRHDYYILHNGVMTDADSKISEITKEGYKFSTRVDEIKYYRAGGKLYEIVKDTEVNDSEVLGYYTARVLEGLQSDLPLYGAIASIVVQVSKKTGKAVVYVMRNHGNPLKVRRDKGTLLISSEGEGVMLEAHQLWRVDMKRKTLEKVRALTVGKSYTEEYRGSYGFSHSPTTPIVTTNDAIVDNEIRARIAFADKCFSDFEEVETYLCSTDTEAEARGDIVAWRDEAQEKWLHAEELLDEVLEENGKTREQYTSTKGYNYNLLSSV